MAENKKQNSGIYYGTTYTLRKDERLSAVLLFTIVVSLLK